MMRAKIKYLALAALLLATSAAAQVGPGPTPSPCSAFGTTTGTCVQGPGILGAATGTSLALGGATIGSNALAVTGSINASGSIQAGGNGVSLGGNVAIPAGGAISWSSRSAIFAPSDGVLLVQNNANTNFTRLILGTNDTSGIAIKKNATTFNFRLGDDSADAAITAGAGTFSGAITVPGVTTAALTSTGTFTSGAGASVGTLTNAPSAGNPTSWIKINDNGVTRYIPAW